MDKMGFFINRIIFHAAVLLVVFLSIGKSSASDLEMSVYIFDVDILCKNPSEFSGCEDISGEKLGIFLEKLEDDGVDFIKMKVKESIRSRDSANHRSFFRSLNDYHRRLTRGRGGKRKAALFVFEVAKHQGLNVQFFRRIKNDIIAPSAKNVKNRYYYYMDARFLHHKENAWYNFVIDGDKHPFRFKR